MSKILSTAIALALIANLGATVYTSHLAQIRHDAAMEQMSIASAERAAESKRADKRLLIIAEGIQGLLKAIEKLGRRV